MLKITEWALKLSGNVESSLAKISGQADGVAKKFVNLQDKIGGVSRGLGGLRSAALGVLAGVSIGAFVNTSLAAFDSQAKANAQLQASLISTKGVAGKTFEELEAAASKFQRTTLFEDDATMGAQAMLLTFTKVRGEIYDKAIPAILDFATAMKLEDPRQAALQLGKALNDPVQGIAALRRAGVQFSENQQTMIKHMVETNQLAKAQEIILGELATQFGGSAEAAAKAGMGPIQLARHAFADVMEKMGMMIAKVFMDMLPYIYKFIDLMGQLVGWLERNWSLISDIFSSIYTGVKITLEIFGPFLAMIGAITAAQWAWNIAMTANPIGLIIVGVAALIAGIVLLWKRCEEFRGFLYAFWETVKSIFSMIADLIADVFGGWLDMITGIITFDFDQFTGGLKRIFNSVTDTAGKFGKEAGNAWSNGMAKGISEVAQEKAIKGNNNSLSAFASGSAFAGAAGGPGSAPMNEANSELKKGANSISEGSKQVRNVTVNITKLIETVENHFSTSKDISNGELEKKITEVVIRALNGAEVAMSNG